MAAGTGQELRLIPSSPWGKKAASARAEDEVCALYLRDLLASSLSDLKLSAARDRVGQVILAAFGALADEQLPPD